MPSFSGFVYRIPVSSESRIVVFGFPSMKDKKAANLFRFVVNFCVLKPCLALESDRTNRTLATVVQP